MNSYTMIPSKSGYDIMLISNIKNTIIASCPTQDIALGIINKLRFTEDMLATINNYAIMKERINNEH